MPSIEGVFGKMQSSFLPNDKEETNDSINYQLSSLREKDRKKILFSFVLDFFNSKPKHCDWHCWMRMMNHLISSSPLYYQAFVLPGYECCVPV